MKSDKQDNSHQIAFLVTAAAVLQILESLFPNPFPGIRLGLANIITVITLVNFGFKATLEVAILRTIISSFIIGTFLSPSFVLSFCAALASSLIMNLLYRVSLRNEKIYFSLVGISVGGAITHNLVQITLVYLMLIRHTAVFMITPWLMLSSLAMGWVNGLISIQVCRMLNKIKNHSRHTRRLSKINADILNQLKTEQNPTGTSLIHAIPVTIKIGITLIIAISLVVISNLYAYMFISVFLIAGMGLSRLSLSGVASKIKRMSSFLLISFIIPTLFTPEGVILFHFGFVKITQSGLWLGSVFVLRLILLMISTQLLVSTSTTGQLITGLNTIMRPLRYLKIDTDRLSRIITLSWTLVPLFSNQVTGYIKKHKFKKKTLRKLSYTLVGIITLSMEQFQEETLFTPEQTA